jgi:hypothetical protein
MRYVACGGARATLLAPPPGTRNLRPLLTTVCAMLQSVQRRLWRWTPGNWHWQASHRTCYVLRAASSAALRYGAPLRCHRVLLLRVMLGEHRPISFFSSRRRAARVCISITLLQPCTASRPMSWEFCFVCC